MWVAKSIGKMGSAPVWLPSSQPELGDDDLMLIDEPAVGDSTHNVLGNLGHDSVDSSSDDGDPEDEDYPTKGWVINDAPRPRKISERKRADNAAFDLWIERNHLELSKGRSRLIVDDDKSVSALVRDFENKRIIASPRDYQLELFERAKTQNTIAVLDTGESSTGIRRPRFLN